MKKLIISFLLGLLPLFASAQNELLFTQANEAYNKGDYTKAVELYEKIEKTGNVSENLYFNLANSYYKLQKVAPSIYNYEKALSIAPNNQDIIDNYRFAQNMRIDQIDSLPQGILTRTYKSLVNLWSVDTWAWLSVVFVFLFAIAFFFFYRAKFPQERKLFFGGWSLSIILSLLCLIFAFQTESYKANTNFAIVFASESTIQSEPNLRSEKLFKLHEGAKVQVLDNIDDWKQIKLTDGKTGWIAKTELKEI